ncbi:MAG: hypothetical protein FWC27_10295 [Firmicutes bacterium]|nr:hypothetical protein [Bacillota bacterium]
MKPKRGRRPPRGARVKYCAVALAAAAAVLSAGFAVRGTLAWLNHSDSKSNGIGIMQYMFSNHIREDFEPPAAGTSLTGGQEVKKESWVANDGDIPAFVRVKVFPVLTSPDGLLHFEAQFGKQLRFAGLSADWMYGGDGYYYYLGVVPPGETTPPLFEKIELDEDVVTYSDAVLTVTLIAETVETRKWHYRDAWWENTVAGSRTAVDSVLSAFAAG